MRNTCCLVAMANNFDSSVLEGNIKFREKKTVRWTHFLTGFNVMQKNCGFLTTLKYVNSLCFNIFLCCHARFLYLRQLEFSIEKNCIFIHIVEAKMVCGEEAIPSCKLSYNAAVQETIFKLSKRSPVKGLTQLGAPSRHGKLFPVTKRIINFGHHMQSAGRCFGIW